MNSPTLSPFPCALSSATMPLAEPSPFWCRSPLPQPPAEPASRFEASAGLPPWPESGAAGHPFAETGSKLRCLPLQSDPGSRPAPPSPFTAVPPVPMVHGAATSTPPPLAGRIPLMASFAEPATPARPHGDFTDADLSDALGPIIRHSIQTSVFNGRDGLSAQLEPLLRSTIRRALAEHNPASRPFRPPGLLDRLCWRLLALFTSRTYEEIVFEKTNRFQVEEVFLLDRRSLAMISYASNDPARHSSPRRIEATVQRLAQQVLAPEGGAQPSFSLPDRRTALTCQGEFGILVAVTRGTPNELLLADLEFSLRRIEDRFHARLEAAGQPMLQELQPFLEDCLLIQAPAAA